MMNTPDIGPSPFGSDKKAPESPKPLMDKIDRALVERPTFSFRLKLTLGFFLLFFLSMAIIIGSMIAINRIQKKLHFSQTSERFLFEIEQTRRWEKNYFLYGTNLTDAAQGADNAKILLAPNINAFKTFSPRHTDKIVYNLNKYQDLIQELISLDRRGAYDLNRKQEIETALRKHLS